MADCTSVSPRFAEVEKMLPSWWQVGAKFKDKYGSVRVVLPSMGWRTEDFVEVRIGDHVLGHTYEIKFRPIEHVYAWEYKNEVHLGSIERSLEDSAFDLIAFFAGEGA